MRLAGFVFAAVLASGCNQGPSTGQAPVKPEPSPTVQPQAAAPAKADVKGASPYLGARIGDGPTVPLTDIAKSPSAYKGKTVITAGTVTAVCEHAGCWMEIKDDRGSAHIKMAGHAFAIPRSASGRRARVEASLLETGQKVEGHHDDCNAEAEQQTGKELPKLQLVATGVELL